MERFTTTFALAAGQRSCVGVGGVSDGAAGRTRARAGDAARPNASAAGGNGCVARSSASRASADASHGAGLPDPQADMATRFQAFLPGKGRSDGNHRERG